MPKKKINGLMNFWTKKQEFRKMKKKVSIFLISL